MNGVITDANEGKGLEFLSFQFAHDLVLGVLVGQIVVGELEGNENRRGWWRLTGCLMVVDGGENMGEPLEHERSIKASTVGGCCGV